MTVSNIITANSASSIYIQQSTIYPDRYLAEANLHDGPLAKLAEFLLMSITASGLSKQSLIDIVRTPVAVMVILILIQ